MEWPKIVLFGDSQTRRAIDPDYGSWAGHLAANVSDYFDVDVRGFEGYNTKWALESMPVLFPATYLSLVSLFVIFLGHNDGWNEYSPLRIPLADYEANLRKIVKYLENNGVDTSKILMMTPVWHHQPTFEIYCRQVGWPPIGKVKEGAKKYADAMQTVARDNNIDVVDFFTLSANNEPRLKEMFREDGIHLSRYGGKLLADLMLPVVRRKLEMRYGKPMSELYHVVPAERRPEVVTALTAYRQMLKVGTRLAAMSNTTHNL